MENIQHKSINTADLFNTGYICGKTLFLYSFNMLPSAAYVGYTDGEKSFAAIKKKYAALIVAAHGYRYFGTEKKKCDFNETYLVLSNRCVIEFDRQYCEIYHDGTQDDFLADCISLMRTFKVRPRRQPLEINLVTKSRTGLELRGMEIKRTRLNLDLYYEDDFKETDRIICDRLNKSKDKGIVLLHGLPGTGKTTYLRHLIGKIKKKVLFLSPGAAANVMEPDFIELLIANPNCVLVIEDAENIIMDRKTSANASVSNLLNISDGLLADFLNVQVICTFNNSLTLVDEALLRKGRLIAKYEFGRLGINKSQLLSRQLGFDTIVNEPMTIAEIANQHETTHKTERVEIIGFRRQAEMLT